MLFVLSSNTPTCHHISTNTLVSFSLFQATGKGIYASNTESYPCFTINLCPADRHDKAEKSVKLFVITCHLQVTPIRVLKVLIEHRLSVFLPLLPRILSLSLNLSLRHRMYNCIHHRVVSPHLSLQHEKLPRPLNLSSISSSLPQTRPTFTPSPFVSETHCSSASTWCQESCGDRIDKHHCIVGKF